MKRRKKNLPLNFTERSKAKVSLICSIVVLVLLCIVFRQMDQMFVKQEAEKEQKRQEEEAKAQAESREVYTANIAAVGDNLYGSSLYASGQSDTTSSWNFDHVYSQVSAEIQAADLALVSQEALFTSNHDEVSSSDTCAAPTEVGDALANAGFDVVEHASEPAFDYGSSLIDNTLSFWSTNHTNVTPLGIHSSQEDAGQLKVVEVNQIRIALLNYTFGVNSDSFSSGDSYRIDVFDKSKIDSMLQAARESSDCIIFCAHWGEDADTSPSEFEKQWAVYLMQQGVDVLLGSHPRTLQPYGTLSDGQGNEMLVYYSLGSFVSNEESLERLLGGMAKFTIEKTVDGEETTVSVTNQSLEPTVMHYNYDTGDYGVYMLADYTDDLASSHSVRYTVGDSFSVQGLQTEFDTILSENVTPSTVTTEITDSSADAEGSDSQTDNAENSSDGSTDDSEDDSYEDSGSYDESYDESDEDSGYYDESYDESYDDSEYYE